MSLIRGIHQSPIKQKLFRSFASLCQELNTELIAEGIEVAEERDCLNSLGGDLYQGYPFARPRRGFPSPAYCLALPRAPTSGFYRAGPCRKEPP